jgi:hypothetical protein
MITFQIDQPAAELFFFAYPETMEGHDSLEGRLATVDKVFGSLPAVHPGAPGGVWVQIWVATTSWRIMFRGALAPSKPVREFQPSSLQRGDVII